jgi:tetratricopeptide (TPR) repeat protein
MIGTTLSHYRIVKKIGEGGMGEVYRAHDERLDRDVAIKVLPEAVAQNPDRLARFEREAKAVAKLSHSNILEIFDYGREGDTTYAVTELLEGRSLREALVGGPMPWKKAIDIGAAVADGLARAHDKNVVHRDIKPSNIFVCSDVSKTIERCLEKEPEHRFQSASDLAYNLRTISSGSAPAFSGPARRATGRRRSIVRFAVAAAALIAIVIGVTFWAPWRKVPEPSPEIVPNRVAIEPFNNRTGDPSLDAVGAMAADEIAHRFTETGAAEAVPILEGPEESSDGERALRLARERGAAFLLSGAYYLDADSLRLQARLFGTLEGDLIYAFEPVAANGAVAAEAIETMGERVLAAVAMHLLFDFDISVIRPPSNYDAFQAFLQGFVVFGKDSDVTYQQCKRALELDPRFYSARSLAVLANFQRREWDLARQDLAVVETHLAKMPPFEQAYYEYLTTSLTGEGERKLLALRRMQKLAPQISFYRSDLGKALISRNRPREAIQTLEPILLSFFDQMTHGSTWPLEFTCCAHHMLGEYEKELEYAELGLKHFPDGEGFYLGKAGALAALGETAKVSRVIDELLRVQTRDWPAGLVMAVVAMELRAHGHRDAAEEMAARSVGWCEAHSTVLEEGNDGEEMHWYVYALWIAGRLETLDELIANLPDTGINGLQRTAVRGWIAARRGDHEKAMQISDSVLEGDDYHRSWVTYRRASIAAHLGDKERAVDLLTQAFSNGYVYSQLPHADPGFEPLWDYPPFQDLIRPNG